MSALDLPREWLYARLQAVGRAQSRYLLLLLFGSGYTLAAHLTGGAQVEVPFLGLKVDRALVEAFAVSVLIILALAFVGTAEAADSAYEQVAKALGKKPADLAMHLIDEHPNMLDFLSFATLVEGKPRRPFTRLGLLLYPLPLAFALVWAAALWWIGVCARPWHPPWLLAVHIVNAAILILAVVRVTWYLRRRWQHFRDYYVTRQPKSDDPKR